ncbi:MULTISPECIES: serine/threonine protein kinase [unclassified Candidatus Frackibacter]|uniref:serine/threonine protein kinase n=1 Tax=unclassified Candidatus Frackibacter TaxID=2648818 RepID=UPI000889793F|nr:MULTISPECIES: protein kinase [unclassified Candidatus Frackibacter]SDC16297.1 Serine/threonine protein kinase [Candidatus Frackibacter sp. WG11]SEM45392.1 Serine/threonine protein kinase [Candidatus Frackibacter sp. WG12]SFL47696.1 Serine/threonine protein kinase [Candidatus Frackibacter sp. WG13]
MQEACQETDYIYLPEGTILKNNYRIKDNLVTRSNFSIVYLAERIDTSEEVVIKEFFPKNLALRDLDAKSVVCKNNLFKDKFKEECNSFSKEAKLMIELENKYVAKCYDYFKENNTSYIVIKYYQGKTLGNYLNENNLNFKDFLRGIYLPLLDAVNNIHKEGYIHRDIKPSNIIIYNKQPIIIDFGSVIDYKKDFQKKVLLTPGFSPIELYSEKTRQGCYSDIYSLAAILYYYFTQKIPREAVDRIIEDKIKEVNELNQEVSSYLNRVIMRNLSLNYKDRDQKVWSLQLKLWKEYIKIEIKDSILKLFNGLTLDSSN